MLSYMIPGEDKAPPGTPQKNHLQLHLQSTQLTPVLDTNMTITETRQIHNQNQNKPVGILNTTNKTIIKHNIIKNDNGINTHRIEKTILKTNNNNSVLKSDLMFNVNNRSLNDSGVSTGDEGIDGFQNGGIILGGASPGSDIITHGVDKPKLKLLANGGKQQTLKRVSFGSSKGSMVETLVFESPSGGALPEEPDLPDTAEIMNVPFPFPEDLTEQEEIERSKVRVSFFQSSRPQCVSPPPTSTSPEGFPYLDIMNADPPQLPTYDRQASQESGWDNPFIPGGELSREAEEIVNRMKVGLPITPVATEAPEPIGGVSPTLQHKQNGSTPAAPASPGADTVDIPAKINSTSLSSAAPSAGNRNGTPASSGPQTQSPRNNSVPVTTEVQHTTLSPPAAPQTAEHVVLKKKPKCKCCVIQ